MAMEFKKFHQQAVKQLNLQIKQILAKWRREAGKINKNLLPLVDEFIKSFEGGKRLRGSLVVLGYEIGKLTTDYRLPTTAKSDLATAKTEDRRLKTVEIIKVAAAYEIFHSAILVHDDIMDKSLLRRGRPSLHQALGGGDNAISQAINLGDAGFFLALKIIAESSFSDQVKNQALKWFCQTMLDTSIGQMLDLAKQDPIAVAKLKTAKYTITGPLVLGAMLGGMGYTSVINKFGSSLGVAFQIKDDLLDLEVKVWGGSKKALEAAEKYKNQALKVLPEITKDKEMSTILQELAEYLVERKK